MRLLVATLVAVVIVALFVVAARAYWTSPPDSPFYRFCNGHVESVADWRHASCPDGSLRLVA